MIEVFDELAVIGDAIDEEDRVVQILANLPDSYSMLVTALEANAEVPKLELVTERLLHEERKIKEKLNSSVGQDSHKYGENALLASNRFRSYPPKICYYCGKPGHIKAVCEELKKKINEEQMENKKTEVQVANFSYTAQSKQQDSYYSDDECIALISEVVQETEGKWIVDSAAGSHMCKNENELENLKKLKRPKKVKVGNGQYVVAHKEGTVKLLIKSAKKIRKVKLHNVLLVPELQYNLFSVSKAAELGKKVVFSKTGCHIIDGSTKEVIGSAIKVGKLYYLECINEEEQKFDTVYKSDMEKAIISIRENNFREEMTRRLNLIEEGTRRPENSYTFKEESNKNVNLEDLTVKNTGAEVMKNNFGKEDLRAEFQEDQKVDRKYFQEEVNLEFQEDKTTKKADLQEDSSVEKNNSVDDKKVTKDKKNKSDRPSHLNEVRVKNSMLFCFCSVNPVSATKETSITNRQGYLINMLFKEFPISSMTVQTPIEDLD